MDRATKRDKRKAIHEAAHAVVAHLLGEEVSFVTLSTTAADNAGSSENTSAAWRHKDGPREAWAEGLEIDAVTSLAGPIAEHKYKPSGGSLPQWKQDGEQANDLAIRAAVVVLREEIPVGEFVLTAAEISKSDEVLERARRRAEELVETSWPAILKVADLLLETRFVSGRDVAAIARGQPSSADLSKIANALRVGRT